MQDIINFKVKIWTGGGICSRFTHDVGESPLICPEMHAKKSIEMGVRKS